MAGGGWCNNYFNIERTFLVFLGPTVLLLGSCYCCGLLRHACCSVYIGMKTTHERSEMSE